MELAGIIVHYVLLAAWTGMLVWGHFKSVQFKKELEDKIKDLHKTIESYEKRSEKTISELESYSQKSVNNHLRDADHLLYRIWSLEAKIDKTSDKLHEGFCEIRAWFDDKRK